jgi:hypothetical protein
MAKSDFYPKTFDGVDAFVGNLVTYVTGKVTAGRRSGIREPHFRRRNTEAGPGVGEPVRVDDFKCVVR